MCLCMTTRLASLGGDGICKRWHLVGGLRSLRHSLNGMVGPQSLTLCFPAIRWMALPGHLYPTTTGCLSQGTGDKIKVRQSVPSPPEAELSRVFVAIMESQHIPQTHHISEAEWRPQTAGVKHVVLPLPSQSPSREGARRHIL